MAADDEGPTLVGSERLFHAARATVDTTTWGRIEPIDNGVDSITRIRLHRALPLPAAGGHPAGTPDGPTATDGRSADTGGPATEPIGADDEFALPPELAARFRFVREIDAGGQGFVVLCESRSSGKQVAIKLFERRVRPDADDPRLAWSDLDPTHVVRFVDPAFGRFRRQWWEVLEYCPGGTLKDLARQHGGTIPPEVVVPVIRQITEALDYLHSRRPHRLVHRDIKPANILIRGFDPIDVVLTDFGLAVSITGSVEFHSVGNTPRYAAPEAIGTGAAPESIDWWSFGMSLAELTTGRHPYQGENGSVDWRRMFYEIDVRPVPLDYVEDERLRLLLRGLLTRNPVERWRAAQIRQWLAGGSPAVADLGDRRGSSLHPFSTSVFTGSFTTPSALAAAMAADWNAAGRLISGRDLEELGAWLDRWFPDIHIDDIVSGRGSTASPYRRVDRAVTELLVRLDPTAAPVFRGQAVSPHDLAALAERGAREDQVALRTLDELHGSQALRSFAGHTEHAELAGVDARWNRAIEATEAWFTRVRTAGSMSPALRAELLVTALAEVGR